MKIMFEFNDDIKEINFYHKFTLNWIFLVENQSLWNFWFGIFIVKSTSLPFHINLTKASWTYWSTSCIFVKIIYVYFKLLLKQFPEEWISSENDMKNSRKNMKYCSFIQHFTPSISEILIWTTFIDILEERKIYYISLNFIKFLKVKTLFEFYWVLIRETFPTKNLKCILLYH